MHSNDNPPSPLPPAGPPALTPSPSAPGASTEAPLSPLAPIESTVATTATLPPNTPPITPPIPAVAHPINPTPTTVNTTSGAPTTAAAGAAAVLSQVPRSIPAIPGPLAPPIHHLQHAPPALTRSQLPIMLKRLAYIVSIVLGSSAVVAGLWSALLLPLLHATYSARTALVAAQRERWGALIDGLKHIRALAIYPAVKEDDDSDEQKDSGSAALALTRTTSAGSKDKLEDKEKDTGGMSPRSARSATITTADDSQILVPSSGLHADAAPLSAALRDLAASMDATSTTRTSLVSTLEGYNSALHRELFISRGVSSWGAPGRGPSSVGLGTLGANLAQAGGNVSGMGTAAGESGLGLPPAKGPEWDAVRREVRAIKGVLLNRRNFAAPKVQHAPKTVS